MTKLLDFDACETRDEAAVRASLRLANALRDAIEARGRASLMLSGGSTPEPIYDRLAHADLNWSKVTVGLVDERWVSPADSASNEGLVRRSLLQGRAGDATFLPMKRDGERPSDALERVATDYASAPRPFDAVVLGMGPDGHTASWFPGSRGLEAAINPENPALVAQIDAAGCPVAGDHHLRMTLTLSAIAEARLGVLALFGDGKRRVLDKVGRSSALDLPVRAALEAMCGRLAVVWAP